MASLSCNSIFVGHLRLPVCLSGKKKSKKIQNIFPKEISKRKFNLALSYGQRTFYRTVAATRKFSAQDE